MLSQTNEREFFNFFQSGNWRVICFRCYTKICGIYGKFVFHIVVNGLHMILSNRSYCFQSLKFLKKFAFIFQRFIVFAQKGKRNFYGVFNNVCGIVSLAQDSFTCKLRTSFLMFSSVTSRNLDTIRQIQKGFHYFFICWWKLGPLNPNIYRTF